jgi:hypothetical protein
MERVECIVPLGSVDVSFTDRNLKRFKAGGIHPASNVTSVDDVTAREAIGTCYVFVDELQFNSDIIEMYSKFCNIFRFNIILVFSFISFSCIYFSFYFVLASEIISVIVN